MRSYLNNIVGLLMILILVGCDLFMPSPNRMESYKSRCIQGDSSACHSVGDLYKKGIGVPQSDYKARLAYKKGCEDGKYSRSCSEFGKMVAQGIGNIRDDFRIKQNKNIMQIGPDKFEENKLACNAGNMEKCYEVGYMYQKGIGTEKNKNRAIKSYKLACESSNKNTLDSCYELGNLYFLGRNYSKAKQLFEHTCNSEVTKGCAGLGDMYLNGWGIKQDTLHAIELLQKSCRGNSAEACRTLGTLYITGQGVRENYNKAHDLFDKSCRNGDALACHNMGNIYENGIGRAQNRQDAKQFYDLACKAGLKESCDSAKHLLKSM